MHKVLLVGLGQIAMGYDIGYRSDDLILTHAHAFAVHPEFQLVGGVDSNKDRCALFAKHYEGYSGTDLRGALEFTKPDVVVIGVPTETHYAVLQDILESSSVRLILCEKPLANKIQEGRAMVAACREKGCMLYVNYQRRVDPSSREIKRRLIDGRIANPVKGVAWYSKGLLHNGSHFSNLLEYWLGPIKNFRVIEVGRLWDDNDPEPDVQMTFGLGTVTFMAAKEENFSHHEIQLVAPNGCLRYEHGGGKVLWQPAIVDPTVEGYNVLASDCEVICSESHKLQWHVTDSVSACLSGRSSSLCSGKDALQTLEIHLKIKADYEQEK